MAALELLVAPKPLDYICETCQQANQFTPQLAVQCRFCGGHILSKPRTTIPKPIKMFGCDVRRTKEDDRLEALQALTSLPVGQRLAISIVRLQKFKESFIEDLVQQLAKVSPKARKSPVSLRKFLDNIFSSWFLTANARGQLDVMLFPIDSIIIQEDLVSKLKEADLPKIVSAVHVNFPDFESMGISFDLPLMDLKATNMVNVQGTKTKVSPAQVNNLLSMYKGEPEEFDLHVYYLYNIYNIIGTKLCDLPASVFTAASSSDEMPAVQMISTGLTAQADSYNTFFFFEQEIWGSKSEPFKFKVGGSGSGTAPVYIMFTLDRNLANLSVGYLAQQLARPIKSMDLLVILPKKAENPFEAVAELKKLKAYKAFKTLDAESHRLLDPDLNLCKPNKDDFIMLHLANYEDSPLKMSPISRAWKN